jgi:hypothetical protein
MIGIIKSMPPLGAQPVAMNRDMWIYIGMPTKWIVFFRVLAIFKNKGVEDCMCRDQNLNC